MNLAALFVAVLALLFTLGSFWWLNARRGQVECSRPRAYSFVGIGRQLRLRLPLAFLNTGATDRVVDDLRVVINDSLAPLGWETTRDRLRPETNDGFAYATPFTVHGRSTRELIVEFGEDPQAWMPESGSSHELRIEGQLHPSETWVEFTRFTWWAPKENSNSYITHRNAV